VSRGEQRLGVEGVEVDGPSLHEQGDDPLRPRREVRSAGRQRVLGPGSERRGERATPGGVADGRPNRITPLV
jgi:hypothetical protein